MKEIVAIIRPKMVGKTKDALEKLGFPSITAISVLGRGKQRGIAGEINVEFRPGILEQVKNGGMKYVPKRQISIVVKDADADLVVDTITSVNQTGQIGDGRIFVCPMEEVLRVRTNETGEDAIV